MNRFSLLWYLANIVAAVYVYSGNTVKNILLLLLTLAILTSYLWFCYWIVSTGFPWLISLAFSIVILGQMRRCFLDLVCQVRQLKKGP